MIQITIRKAISAIAHAVEEKGYDFVYQRFAGHGCAYVHYDVTYNEDGSSERCNLETGCIVGNALHCLGVPLEAFLGTQGGGSPLNSGHDAYQALTRLRGRGILELDKGVAEILQAAQSLQDDGKTWGEALRDAKAKAYDVLLMQGKI